MPPFPEALHFAVRSLDQNGRSSTGSAVSLADGTEVAGADADEAAAPLSPLPPNKWISRTLNERDEPGVPSFRWNERASGVPSTYTCLPLVRYGETAVLSVQ